MSRQAGARDVDGQGLISKDEHAVHQLDQLVHLAREHDDTQTFRSEAIEQCVQFAVGAEIDAAGGIVQEQDSRLRRSGSS